MLKGTAWLKAASSLQILTGVVHGLSLFTKPQPQNDTEKQLVDLMYTYKMQMGAGFEPTMADLFTSLSACFSLMYLFAGVINFYLLRKNIPSATWKGLLLIQMIFFFVAFAEFSFLTFLPPIILTGIVFGLLCVSYWRLRD